MANVTIDNTTIESVETADEFEKLRQEFDRLSTDNLAERYNISSSFINEDGSFTEEARNDLLEEQGVDLVAKTAALQSLRNTEEASQLDERVETNIGDTLGGVSPEYAKELQKQRVQQQQQQEREETRRRAANQTPKLQEIDNKGNVISEIKPTVVTRFGGTKPFDSDSTQLQDGQTVTDQRGDTNVRVNMEMVLTHSDFVLLNEITNTGNRLRVVSSSYTGPATFDQLKFDRIPDSNGQVTPDGTTQNALYTVQLQSKEQSDEDESLIQPFTEE